MIDKRAKRWRRENRDKRGSWACGNCGARHQNGHRCPHPRRGDLQYSGLSLAEQILMAGLLRGRG